MILKGAGDRPKNQAHPPLGDLDFYFPSLAFSVQ